MCQHQGRISSEEWAFLLTGGAADAAAGRPAPTPWLSPRAWREATALGQIQGFQALEASLREHGEAWRAVWDCAAPHAAALPGGFDALAPFQRLLLVRCLRCAATLCTVTRHQRPWGVPRTTPSSAGAVQQIMRNRAQRPAAPLQCSRSHQCLRSGFNKYIP